MHYYLLPLLLRLNVLKHRFHPMPSLKTFINPGYTKHISRNCAMSVEIISGYFVIPTTLFGSFLRLMRAKLKSLVHLVVWQVASSLKQWATWWALFSANLRHSRKFTYSITERQPTWNWSMPLLKVSPHWACPKTTISPLIASIRTSSFQVLNVSSSWVTTRHWFPSCLT